MCLSHNTLVEYYRMNFLMMENHKYSLTEIENMLPWEREAFISLLIQHVEERKQKLEQMQGK